MQVFLGAIRSPIRPQERPTVAVDGDWAERTAGAHGTGGPCCACIDAAVGRDYATEPAGVSMPSHYPIDPSRTDLAREFMANPMGPHSAALQRIVTRMRDTEAAGHYVLVTRVPYKEWVLAQLSGQRGVDVTLNEDQVFTSIEDAERAVFKLRWELITGASLELD